MKMPLDELISQGEEILAKYLKNEQDYIEHGGHDEMYGLACQLEHCILKEGADQSKIQKIMIELYRISEKMGNPLATEQLLIIKHRLH